LIREIKQPSGKFGDIILLRPKKVEEILAKTPCAQGWHQGTVNLAEQGIVGPLNFSIDQTEQHCIIEEMWKALKQWEQVRSGSGDVADLNQITPPQQTEAKPQTVAQLHDHTTTQPHNHTPTQKNKQPHNHRDALCCSTFHQAITSFMFDRYEGWHLSN
jgi:hypothetical protein